MALLGACEKEIPTYRGEEGIYFAVQFGAVGVDERAWPYQPITPIEFINKVGNIDTLLLKVMTTGEIKSFDRNFEVKVVADSSTAIEGVHYETLPPFYTIKAGESYAMIPIVLKRTEDLQDTMKEFMIQLIPNENLSIGIPLWQRLAGQMESTIQKGDFKADFHKIRLSDFFTRPSQWSGQIVNGIEAGLWGEFSEKKYRLICDHFDLIYDDFMSPNTMPQARKIVIQEYMHRFLLEQYRKREPILEEDGRLMWFQGVSWTSRKGVAWGGF